MSNVKKVALLAAAMTLSMPLSSCSKNSPAEPQTPAQQTQDQKEMTQTENQNVAAPTSCKTAAEQPMTAEQWADANNTLALQILRASKGSTVASSFSAQRALGMILDGACGDTAAQMRTALSLPDAPNIGEVGSEIEKKMVEKNGDDATITVENRVWLDKQNQLLDAYVSDVKAHYNAELTPLDFVNQPEEARGTINQSVEKATNGKIKDILPSGSITSMSRLVLTNAIYFKAPWHHAFNAGATKQEDFKTADGAVKVDMMHNTKEYAYYENEQFQAVELGFESSAHAFLVILPKLAENADVTAALEKTEADLTANTLRTVLENMDSKKINLGMPKFRAESSIPLKSILSDLGMKLPFTGDADFSAIAGSRDLFVSDIFHKAYIDIDEKGAEAAAATAGVMMTRALAHPEKPITLNVDHPFIFAIVDTQTNTTLFMGRKVDFK